MLWLAAAILLAIGELFIPGVFLIFLAAAAAITGVASLVLADLPVAAQLVSFAVWSGVTVAIGKRWYRDYPVDSADPLLNDRASAADRPGGDRHRPDRRRQRSCARRRWHLAGERA